MTRRDVVLGGTPLFGFSFAQSVAKPAWFEIRQYLMRNSRTDMVRRTTQFVTTHYLPAVKRAGAGPVGLFTAVVAPQAPFLLVVTGFSSLQALESCLEKLEADAAFQKALEEFCAGPDLAYIRAESTLYRCFPSMPRVEPGPDQPGRTARLFELRTYESDNEITLKRKIRMFGEGEIDIFRRCGIQPVFFGQAVAGARMPHLAYMVAYENYAAREKAWQAFLADPEWQKLRVKPGYADAEIVSSISNALLRPAAGSEIR